MTKREVYSLSILLTIIASPQTLYEKWDTCKCRPITCKILPKLQKTFKDANLQTAFCLASAEFLHIDKFTYDKFESDFRS